MRITSRRAAVVYALILAFIAGVGFFVASLMMNGAEWASYFADVFCRYVLDHLAGLLSGDRKSVV